jgi:hypothetical protein
VRLAGPDDDAEIRAVLRRNAMTGAMSLAFAHEPSFFAAIEVEGDDPRVVVGERGDRLVGIGLMTRRRVYLHGEPADVGYLSSLRADVEERRGLGVARGYRLMQQVHRQDGRVPFYLSTVMEDNTAAREALTSGRGGLPNYREIGRYRSVAIPLLRQRAPGVPGLRMVTGETVGATALADFLNRVGREKQFYPVYTAGDLEAPGGLLRGLRPIDFLVALVGDEIAGTLAVWDQLAFRQHIVTGYAGGLRRLRPWINLLTGALGCRLLPRSGMPVRSLAAACIAVRGDDPAVFRALLQHVLHENAGRERDLLLVGLAVGDPLLPVAEEPWHIALNSRMYTVSWDGQPEVGGRVPYLELGSL